VSGKENDKEEIELAFSFEVDSAAYASTIVSAKSDERITIKMTREGNLISGARSLRRGPGGPTEEKIWRDGKTAYVEQTSGTNKKTIRLDIPEGRTLALEGSLLVLLRFFPYDSATGWVFFMIVFSKKSVTATARQAGIERVTWAPPRREGTRPSAASTWGSLFAYTAATPSGSSTWRRSGMRTIPTRPTVIRPWGPSASFTTYSATPSSALSSGADTRWAASTDKSYAGRQASAHMQDKRRYFKDRIVTPTQQKLFNPHCKKDDTFVHESATK
jgi:hypothetical protein